MQIAINNVFSKAIEITQEEEDWLYEYLTFEDPAAKYARFRAKGTWSVKQYLYKRHNKLLYTGMLPTVYRAAKNQGFEIKLLDMRKEPVQVNEKADLSWLRDYQLKSVEIGEQRKTGIFKIPTGGGKTELLPAFVLRHPCHWLFVVHRKDLMHQAAERFTKRTGLIPGKIGDSEWNPDPDERLTVATFQTLSRALSKKGPEHDKVVQFLASIKGLIVDEAHTLAAASFLSVATKCINAYWRFGLSGTPLARGDKKSIFTVACLGPIIYELSPQILINAGLLAVPQIKMIKVPQLAPPRMAFNDVYKDCVITSQSRNEEILKAVEIAEKPCLLFVKQIKHGENLHKAIRNRGINCDFVWGEKDTGQRKKAIQRLIDGDTDVVVCSVIFEMGIDIPDLRSVVIGSGGKSVIATLQRIGRGMRPTKDKSTFQVFDFFDIGHPWMENHSKKRKKAYEKEGYKVELVS